jgi:hypothetical protein
MSVDEIWRFIFSLSAAFPAIASIIQFKKANPLYRPFFVYSIVSLINELCVGVFIIRLGKQALNINNNLFVLFEALILFTQFYYWRKLKERKKIFQALIIATLVGWATENIIANNISHFHPVFIIAYSFLLVLLSVQTINFIIVNEARQPLIKNAKFIICTAMVVFFVYNIFVQAFMSSMVKTVDGIKVYDKELVANIFAIQVYINAFTNILYGIAVCLVPRKISEKDFFKSMPS